MFYGFGKLRKPTAISLAAGITIWLTSPAAAEPTRVIEIKVKQVVYFESADGKAAGRISRAEFEVPLDIIKTSPNKRFLVTVHGKELWISKMVTKTDEVISSKANCQTITKSYAASRGFGDCN